MPRPGPRSLPAAMNTRKAHGEHAAYARLSTRFSAPPRQTARPAYVRPPAASARPPAAGSGAAEPCTDSARPLGPTGTRWAGRPATAGSLVWQKIASPAHPPAPPIRPTGPPAHSAESSSTARAAAQRLGRHHLARSRLMPLQGAPRGARPAGSPARTRRAARTARAYGRLGAAEVQDRVSD